MRQIGKQIRILICMACISGIQADGGEQAQTIWHNIADTVCQFLRHKTPFLEEATAYCTQHAPEAYEVAKPYLTQNTAIGAAATLGGIGVLRGVQYGWNCWDVAQMRNKKINTIISKLEDKDVRCISDICALPLDAGFENAYMLLHHLNFALNYYDDNKQQPKDWATSRFKIQQELGHNYTVGKETFDEIITELDALRSWLEAYEHTIKSICHRGNITYDGLWSSVSNRINDVQALRNDSTTPDEAEEHLGYIQQWQRAWRRKNRTVQKYSLGTLSIPRLATIGSIGYLWYAYAPATPESYQ